MMYVVIRNFEMKQDSLQRYVRGIAGRSHIPWVLGDAVEVTFMAMIVTLQLGYTRNPYNYGYISTYHWNCCTSK